METMRPRSLRTAKHILGQTDLARQHERAGYCPRAIGVWVVHHFEHYGVMIDHIFCISELFTVGVGAEVFEIGSSRYQEVGRAGVCASRRRCPGTLPRVIILVARAVVRVRVEREVFGAECVASKLITSAIIPRCIMAEDDAYTGIEVEAGRQIAVRQIMLNHGACAGDGATGLDSLSVA